MNASPSNISLAKTLEDMGNCLGIGHQTWIVNEWPQKILIVNTVDTRILTLDCILKILAAITVYGDSISITIGPNNQEFPLQIKDPAIILSQVQALSVDNQLPITIEIDKTRYLQVHYPDIAQTGRTLLYIFPEKITRIFTDSSLIDLQELIWGYAVPANSISVPTFTGLLEQVFILVPDETMLYAGDYLVLIGGEYLTTKRPDWILTRKSNSIDAYDRCMEIRHNELLWPPNYTLAVTPWHFYLIPPRSRRNRSWKSAKTSLSFSFHPVYCRSHRSMYYD